MRKSTVFIVSDVAATRDSLKALVKGAGLEAETFPSLQAFLRVVSPGSLGCLVVDAHNSCPTNHDQALEFADCCTRMPVIVIAEHGKVEMAVRVMKAGATDVVQKPYRDTHLLGSINKALEANATVQD